MYNALVGIGSTTNLLIVVFRRSPIRYVAMPKNFAGLRQLVRSKTSDPGASQNCSSRAVEMEHIRSLEARDYLLREDTALGCFIRKVSLSLTRLRCVPSN